MTAPAVARPRNHRHSHRVRVALCGYQRSQIADDLQSHGLTLAAGNDADFSDHLTHKCHSLGARDIAARQCLVPESGLLKSNLTL